jgi:hypothetical protein
VSRKRFTRRDTVDLFGTGQSGNVCLNSFCQVKQERYARQCSISNTRSTCEKDILHFDCMKTIDGTAQVTTRRDLRGLLYSLSDIVGLLVQSNCTKLQPLINILIWLSFILYYVNQT